MTLTTYADFHVRSLVERDAFWAEQAQRIDWHTPPQQICDASRPPFARWFVGGTTNLCHNAVDRHAAVRPQAPALIWVSTEVIHASPQLGSLTQAPPAEGEAAQGGPAPFQERVYSFAELQVEVEAVAAMLVAQGVGQGDRVLIYMPMIPEAAFAMLACARIGAIHSVVFGGFASVSLASRIDDAAPKLIVSADAGSRAGKRLAYKPLLDEAITLAAHKPQAVLMVDRGLVPFERVPGRDLDYAALRRQHDGARVPCTWLESNTPSYTLYTSGTTGRPKGVQRDVGGYAVALATSMDYIFGGKPGETYFSTSDIGWVVGHSYIVYGPLIAGMATLMYEGTPVNPDAAVLWRLVEKYRVTVMFSAPTAVRVLKKHDEALLKRHDLSSLRALFLAGEPLDEPTARWIAAGLGVPIIDNYWQTETGWPLLTVAHHIPGVEAVPTRFGSPGVPMYGYDVQLLDEQTGQVLTAPQQKGVLVIKHPLPPGALQTVWGDDARFVNTYWRSVPGREGEHAVYSTFDWGLRDADGYTFILGRTDDVINVAGHRLGTREIEECISSHAAVAEVAVVGVADALKGQVALAFAVLRDPAQAGPALEAELMKHVDAQLGAVARPSRVLFLTLLPKTRSGKLLRRALQAVAEGRDPGDLTTLDDPSALAQVKTLLQK